MRRSIVSSGSLVCALLLSRAAGAVEVGLAVNAEGAASHLVGENKAGQFGWGATGLVAPELKLGSKIGFELPLGVIGLAEAASQDPAYARSASGSAFFAMPGLRLRPFATKAGGWSDALWVAGGGGLAHTGGLARPSVDLRAGVDVQVGRFGVGPFGGMIQIVESAAGVRSEDARLALVGLHASVDPIRAHNGDRDGDGIPDARDLCPDQPEDKDGFQDADGCPDPDNDGDGIPDGRDKCPNDPEDLDGFQDADGCPDPDNDGDGIPDALDKCPDQAEDFDGFQDEDGCPELDNDRDGIPDAQDKCPNEAETVNGYADEDGCPDEEQVRVIGDRIVLDERVHFLLNQSTILFRSHGLMKNVAKLLAMHPEYEKIQVNGHADDLGEEDYNLRLSRSRASAVKELLVKFGVDEKRLVIEFYGKTKPRAPGQTPTARHENRRVEFEIMQRRALVAPPPPLAPRVEHISARAPRGGAR